MEVQFMDGEAAPFFSPCKWGVVPHHINNTYYPYEIQGSINEIKEKEFKLILDRSFRIIWSSFPLSKGKWSWYKEVLSIYSWDLFQKKEVLYNVYFGSRKYVGVEKWITSVYPHLPEDKLRGWEEALANDNKVAEPYIDWLLEHEAWERAEEIQGTLLNHKC